MPKKLPKVKKEKKPTFKSAAMLRKEIEEREEKEARQQSRGRKAKLVTRGENVLPPPPAVNDGGLDVAKNAEVDELAEVGNDACGGRMEGVNDVGGGGMSTSEKVDGSWLDPNDPNTATPEYQGLCMLINRFETIFQTECSLSAHETDIAANAENVSRLKTEQNLLGIEMKTIYEKMGIKERDVWHL